MRKLLAVLLIAIVVTGLGSFAVYAQPPRNTNYQGYMMGGNTSCHRYQNDYTYEWYYLHLSSDNQVLLDLMYLEELAQYDLDTLSTLEKKELVKEIKERLIEYIIDEDLIEYGRT
ncbi:MAG: hypothetical protein Q7I99_05240 [Acholeplasmataceae bacterium]|nr:hypothetical protein [Acholeplasmataceae bacterium]